jgi:hypothetical protein
MTDERNELNEALVTHCGAKAQAEFALMATAVAPNDVLWKAIAATVIIEAARFMRDRAALEPKPLGPKKPNVSALSVRGGERGPFGPSLDRIVPKLGYVTGNIRVVCNLANLAMHKWGEDPLREFVNKCRISAQMTHKKIRQRG